MYGRVLTRYGVRAGTMLCVLLLSACGHWPWHHAPPAPPAEVHDVDISGATAAGIRQSWKRNTLLVDLSAASGSGSITLKPGAAGWPVRIAFRVTPGAIGFLEVQADKRLSLPITPGGSKPVDVELAPGLYSAHTAQVSVSWGPAPVVPELPKP
ncbi:MAG TPA: hypothetical protein VIE42_04980 [Steroidobacteraceae bacterium]